MSIYHICTNCPQKLPDHRCLANENPYDESCEKHDLFMLQEIQKRMENNRNGRYYGGSDD